MVETLTIIVLSTLLALREFLSYKERKDMLDRLMAKSFTEYKDNDKPEPNHLEPQKSDIVELVDAKEALYGEEDDS